MEVYTCLTNTNWASLLSSPPFWGSLGPRKLLIIDNNNVTLYLLGEEIKASRPLAIVVEW